MPNELDLEFAILRATRALAAAYWRVSVRRPTSQQYWEVDEAQQYLERLKSEKMEAPDA